MTTVLACAGWGGLVAAAIAVIGAVVDVTLGPDSQAGFWRLVVFLLVYLAGAAWLVRGERP